MYGSEKLATGLWNQNRDSMGYYLAPVQGGLAAVFVPTTQLAFQLPYPDCQETSFSQFPCLYQLRADDDRFARIATRVYQDSSKYPMIMKANKEFDVESQQWDDVPLQTGKVIVIPAERP